MRRPRPVAAALLAALGLVGCGQKAATDAAEHTDSPPPVVRPVVVAPTPDPSPVAPPVELGAVRLPLPVETEVAPPPAEVGAAVPPVEAVAAVVPPPAAQPAVEPKKDDPKGKDAKDAPKDPPKDPKDAPKDPKPPEYPKEIGGKKPEDFVKDLTDLDPAMREAALRTLPTFGPGVQKVPGIAKGILARMDPSKEGDPGVRAAAYETAGAIAFESEQDTKEAIILLYNAADQGAKGGGTRLHAVQTLAMFGSKAETAVTYLTGAPAADPAYETRRSVANTLGRIGGSDTTGANPKALRCLAEVLAKDRSAAVRLEAYQSIVTLGPPWEGPLGKAPPGGPPPQPKVDAKTVAVLVAAIKKQLLPAPGSPTGVVEKDKQVDVLARMALMRLDPKEYNDDNLNAVAKYIAGPDTGPKLQALNVLGLMGDAGAKRIDDVVKALSAADPEVAAAAVKALVQIGDKAKGAIPFIEKLKDRPGTKEEKEFWARLTDQAVKLIKEAKPVGTSASPGTSGDPVKKP